jgi:hypothetical protein
MSKNSGALGKLYDRLTPEERFRLDVEAKARGDEKESQRLTDTCPRRSYVMNDIGFAGRWDGAVQMSMVSLLDMGQNVAKLRVVDAFRSVLPLSRNLYHNEAAAAYMCGHEAGGRYAWREAGMDGDPPGWEPLGEDEDLDEGAFDPAADADLEQIEERIKGADILPGLLDRLERELATEALAVWHAFRSFCDEEVGLEAEKVLQATFPPSLENIRWLEESAARHELEPAPETVEEYSEALAQGWRKAIRLSR